MFVYTQAAEVSANGIGQWAWALSFGGVKNRGAAEAKSLQQAVRTNLAPC